VIDMEPGTRPSEAAPRVHPVSGTPRFMLGPIVLFGSACFLVFGVIYLTLVGSTYLFLSNLVFCSLCALTWLGGRRLSQAFVASLFLAVVYLGLVNVAVHLGDARSPTYLGLLGFLTYSFILYPELDMEQDPAGQGVGPAA
jgi:hypothetical protein